MIRRWWWFALGVALGVVGVLYLRRRGRDGGVGTAPLVADLFDGAVRLVEKAGEVVGDRRPGGVGSDWSDKPL